MSVYYNSTIVREKSMQLCNCVKADVLWSYSVMSAVQMHNIESISVAEEIIHLLNHANCLHV